MGHGVHACLLGPILRAADAVAGKGGAGRETLSPGPRGVDRGGGSRGPTRSGRCSCTPCAAARAFPANELRA